MRKLLGSIVLLKFFCLVCCGVAGTPHVLWVTTGGGTNLQVLEVGRDLAVDASGNSYVVGTFGSSVTFGPFTLTNTTSSTDSFAAKLDPNGVVQWARQMTGSGDDNVRCVGTDAMGNSYISGGFSSAQMQIGHLTLTNQSTNSAFFVAKLDSDGQPVWARCPDQNTSSVILELAVDSKGNCVLIGTLNRTNVIGGTTINGNSFTDILVLKYDSAGNLIWLKHGGSSGSDAVGGVATDLDGNVYLAAKLHGTNVSFAGFNYAFTNQPRELVVIKLGPDGAPKWTSVFGGPGEETAEDITVDSLQQCYLAGSFTGSNFYLGEITLTQTNLSGTGFVTKLDAGGNPLWAKKVESEANDVRAVGVDQYSNCFVAGHFRDNRCTFASFVFTNERPNEFYFETFIVKLDSSGNPIWSMQPKGTSDQAIFSLALDPLGHVYASGFNVGLAHFGGHSVSNQTPDAFVFKLQSDFPRLDISLQQQGGSSSVLVSWPANAISFVPQYSTNLIDWQFFEGPVVVTNARATIQVPTDSGFDSFFRLVR